MPRKTHHRRFEGEVIGRDGEGVMLELTSGSGCCYMFAPYEMISGELMLEIGEGLVVDVEVGVSDNGGTVSLTMVLHDADQA